MDVPVMAYVAIIGLLFAQLMCLLCTAWFYVRWQNEENEEKALFNKKICKRFLIAAAVSLVVFGVLKIIFPFS